MDDIVATILAIVGAILWLSVVAAGIVLERLQDERRVIPYRELVATGKVRPSATRRTG